jgi:predicted DNA-binding transcriptional regulator AlpA
MNYTSGANQCAIPPLLSGFDQLPDSAHVPIKTVCALFGCSPATAWRRVLSGHLVQPVRFGARSTRWCVGDLRRSLMVMTAVKEAK